MNDGESSRSWQLLTPRDSENVNKLSGVRLQIARCHNQFSRRPLLLLSGHAGLLEFEDAAIGNMSQSGIGEESCGLAVADAPLPVPVAALPATGLRRRQSRPFESIPLGTSASTMEQARRLSRPIAKKLLPLHDSPKDPAELVPRL